MRARTAVALVAGILFGGAGIGHGADDWPFPRGDRDGTNRSPSPAAIDGAGDQRPGVVWSLPTTAASVTGGTATLFDVDGDAELEVLILNRGRLLAWDVLGGALLWASPPLLMDGFLGLYDLDGDGDEDEAVTMSSSPAGGIYVVDARTGAILWSAADYPHAAGVSADETIVGDFDGDGADELLYGLRYSGLKTLSLVKFTGPGNFTNPHVVEDEVTRYDNGNQITAGDFSGTGRDDGFVLPQFDGFDHFRWCTPADAGAVCDDLFEVCTCLVAEYQAVTRGVNYGSTVAADWDGDSVDELLYAGGDEHENVTLGVLDFVEGLISGIPDATDLLLWQYDYGLSDEATFSTTAEVMPGDPQDLDGDGVLDAVVTFWDDRSDEIDHYGNPADDGIHHPDAWAVGVFDAATGTLMAAVLDAVALGSADLDGNGRPELIVRPASGGSLLTEVAGYELSCGAFTCSTTLKWSYSGVAADAFEVKPKSHRSQVLGASKAAPLADLEGDGDPELLAIRNNTTVYALDVDTLGNVAVERSRVVGSCNRVGEVVGSGSSMRILVEGNTCLAMLDNTLTQIGPSVATLPLQGKIGNIAVAPRSTDPAYPVAGGSLYTDPASGEAADHVFDGTVAFAADLDGDGVKELVHYVNDDVTHSFTLEAVTLDIGDIDGDGHEYEVRWTFDSSTDASLEGFTVSSAASTTQAQVDGDAAREVIVVANRSRSTRNLVVLAFDGVTGSRDWTSDTLPEDRQSLMLEGAVLGIADVATSGGVIGTSDGREDIVLTSSSAVVLFAPPTTTPIADPGRPEVYTSESFYADLDGDGRKEMMLASDLASVAARFTSYDVVPGLAEAWDDSTSIDLASDSYSAFAAIEAGGDPGDDVLFADSRGGLWVYDGTDGAPLPGFPVWLTDGDLWTEQQPGARSGKAVASIDVDGDGFEEAIVGVDEGYLYAVDVAEDEVGSTPTLLWSLFIGTRIWSIHPADVDSDGEMELLVASDDGYLHAVDGTPASLTITEPPNDACLDTPTFTVAGVASGVEEVLIEANYALEDTVPVVVNSWSGTVSLAGEGTWIITARGQTDGIDVANDAINVTYQVDHDGDGWIACNGDCNDADPTIHPGALDLCDAIDQDCDGVVADEPDGDGDGFRECEGDCDDDDPAIYPGAPEVCNGVDDDCDGVVDDVPGGDADGDGVTDCGGDCDDTDPTVYPGAPELCNGLDDDCDGAPGEDEADADGDGFAACEGDCDDGAPTVHPGAPELCNGIDDDCDGLVDDVGDLDGDGLTPCEGDCDDGDPAVHPGAPELCNGVDDDCDGAPEPDETDADADGVLACEGDCDDGDATMRPGGTEVCDGRDNDCDGPVDEGTECFDDDGDGLSEDGGDCDDTDPGVRPGEPEVCDAVDQDCDGDADEGTSCSDDDGDGSSEDGGDCHDGDPTVHPGAAETCDGVDEDCDGVVDEGTGCSDDDGDGFTEVGGDCDDADPSTFPGAIETCDGLDQDCDGVTDEGTECFDDDGDGYSELDGDCNDGDPDVSPGMPEVDNGFDDDCDGLIDGETVPHDGDADGWTAAGGDCDDADPAVHPGASEVCDGLDQDCDEVLDEGTECSDDDGDGYSEEQGDCVDTDAGIGPGADEAANGVDDDCDGLVDEGTDATDDDGDGFTEVAGDCDDADPSVWPGAEEVEDGADNDCDGLVDEGTDAFDDDGDGASENGGDCDDANGWVGPEAEELCDGIDNDCDGELDEGCDDGTEEEGTGYDGGCNCSTAEAAPGAGAATALFLPALGLLRRRRALSPRLAAALATAAFAVAGAGCTDTLIEAIPASMEPNPDLLDFGDLATGTARDREVSIDNVGTGVAFITSAVIDDPNTRFVVVEETLGEVRPGAGAPFVVRYSPPDEGDHQATLVVQFQGERDTFAVEVELRGRGHRPDIRIVPESVDFGEVPEGTAQLRTATALNASGVEVTLVGLEVQGDGGFTAEVDAAFPATLPAGGQMLLTLRYDAAAPDAAHATLVIRHTDPDQPEVWLPMAANDCAAGIDPSFDGDGDGFVACAGDCDDSDPEVRPGAIEACDGVDQDCDGLVDDGTECFDDDGDGHSELGGDCHDGDPAIGPGFPEVQNGVDDDCDGLVDEGTGPGDTDGDGYTEAGGDCMEGNGAVHPGADEVPDGLDNDCDGLVDEDPLASDDDGDGYSELDGDCNDADPAVYPGAPPIHGADADCDGVIDSGVDGDGDGWAVDAGDCDDADPSARPGGIEVEDGVDNDCDGSVDEGTPGFDDDGDGFSESDGDCNDSLPDMSPGGAELPDGRDNDCDGTVDEGTSAYDDDGDGWTEDGGDCNDADPSINPGATEAAGNAVDEDCDGLAP
ncbi:choice-of-anchor D domain-containing protein [Myxococcota bacterium]|nr:choice-of-anchor D domain-containing protein [Myxococcota bacterium]